MSRYSHYNKNDAYLALLNWADDQKELWNKARKNRNGKTSIRIKLRKAIKKKIGKIK